MLSLETERNKTMWQTHPSLHPFHSCNGIIPCGGYLSKWTEVWNP